MIEVWGDEGALGLRMEGHAGAERNGEGHDLVCCAASMLAQALMGSCEACEGVEVKGEARPGHVRIWLEAEEGKRQEAAIRLRMTLDGLSMLAAAYPNAVRIRKSPTRKA